MKGFGRICLFVVAAVVVTSSVGASPAVIKRTVSRIPRQVAGVLKKNFDQVAKALPSGPTFGAGKVTNLNAEKRLQSHFEGEVQSNNDDQIFFGKDPSNLPGEEVGDSPYRWRVIIDWTVDNEIALQYMGQLEIFLPAYEWTLGYYYWLRPDGHLQEVFYNSRPDYGFRNEVFVTRDFLPQNWITNKVDYSQQYEQYQQPSGAARKSKRTTADSAANGITGRQQKRRLN